MTSHRRRFLPVIACLAAAAAFLVPAPYANAAGETLQVNKEVNTVPGGTPVTLTARLSEQATAPVAINFSATAPAKDASLSCTVPEGNTTCQVIFNSDSKGTSLVKAHIASSTLDSTEGRLSNADPLPLLTPAADCRTEDDEVLENTCNPSRATPAPGSKSEPDGTDVVEITWTSFV
ncbi:MAG: hypothetical protein M3357_00615, partial [Actinomycetota bacterium]|nr:hypothetical protein [Actinomycetota bacterium]